MNNKKQKQKSTGFVILVLLLSCAACGAFFTLSKPDKQKTFASAVCTRVQSWYGRPCNSDNLISHADAIQACMPDGDIMQTDENIQDWILCLETQGVNF